MRIFFIFASCMATAYISLGTNLGNKQSNLEKAKDFMRKNAGDIAQSSSIYETEPWGFKSKDKFLNQVVVLKTSESPEELLELLLQIEKSMGRNREAGKSYSSRIIDLDILFYNDEIINSDFLKIPHPHIHERKFILIPLNEIDSNLIHPVFDKKISKLLKECNDQEAVSKIPK